MQKAPTPPQRDGTKMAQAIRTALEGMTAGYA
jgi:hypothetical protein